MKILYLLSAFTFTGIYSAKLDLIEQAIKNNDLKKIEMLFVGKTIFVSKQDKQKYIEQSNKLVKEKYAEFSKKITVLDCLRIAAGVAGISLASYNLHLIKKLHQDFQAYATSDEENKHLHGHPFFFLTAFGLIGFSTYEIIKGIIGKSRQNAYNNARLIELRIKEIPTI